VSLEHGGVLQRDTKGKVRKGEESKQEAERHTQGTEPTQRHGGVGKHPGHQFGTRAA
jgi:hypothetical protein